MRRGTGVLSHTSPSLAAATPMSSWGSSACAVKYLQTNERCELNTPPPPPLGCLKQIAHVCTAACLVLVDGLYYSSTCREHEHAPTSTPTLTITLTHAHAHAHTHAHAHAYTRTCTQAHTHAHTHTHSPSSSCAHCSITHKQLWPPVYLPNSSERKETYRRLQ
jgi:hypothetical protein